MGQNPWRSRLAAIGKNCPAQLIRGNFYKDGCPGKVDWGKYSNETYAVHLMKSIAAVIRGMDVFLEEGNGHPFSYSSAALKYENIMKIALPQDLEDVKQSAQRKSRVFNEIGNGNVGYEVYNIVEDNGALGYQLIINIPPGNNVEINFERTIRTYAKNLFKIVSKHESCQVTTIAPTPTTTEPSASWIAPVTAILAILIVCVTVLVVVFFFLKHRSKY